MQEIFPQYFASGSSILIWLSIILGLPDRVRLPLNAYLRHAACLVRANAVVAGCSVLLFVGLLAPVHDIVRCTVNRVLYMSYIQSYSKDFDLQHLVEAFTLIPNRREAILLIENHLLWLGTENTYNLRRAAEQIVNDSELVQVVDRQLSKTLFLRCSCSDSSHNLRPRLWIATILPLAEENNSVKRKLQARDYIKDEIDDKSQAFLSILELELHALCSTNGVDRCGIAIDPKVAVSKLEVFFSKHSSQHTHFFQEGLDHLAQYEVSRCNVTAAIGNYRRILEVRKRWWKTSTSKARWGRSPRKLSLFHVFMEMSGNSSQGETKGLVRNLLDRCDGADFRERMEKEVYDKFPEFHNKSKWYEGSFAEQVDGVENFADTVSETYIKQCWNY